MEIAVRVSVDLVKEALRIAKEKYPELNIDGPMQFDCAYDPKTAAKKCQILR